MSSFIDFLYGATLLELGVVVCAIVVGGTVVALFIVNALWKAELRQSHNDIARFLSAVVGIIFAVLISSLTITVMGRQQQASGSALQEAQVLAAMHREALELPASEQATFRRDLAVYLDDVIDREWPQMRRAQWPDAADAALGAMYQDVARLPVLDLGQMLVSQDLRKQMEKLSELRRFRGDLATTGVDRVIWYVMLLGSASTIFFAVLFGVQNFLAHVLMTCILSFIIALAMIMIIAIDWPYFGQDSNSPGALMALRHSVSFSEASR